MKKEVKIVQLDKDTVVAFGFVDDISFGSAMLDAAGKSSREIEREFVKRFVSQIHNRKYRYAQEIPTMSRSDKWNVHWYKYEDVAKTHVIKENVMEQVCGKPKIYSIEKKADGSLKVNKVEGKLYDEDEVKLALCKMALED